MLWWRKKWVTIVLVLVQRGGAKWNPCNPNLYAASWLFWMLRLVVFMFLWLASQEHQLRDSILPKTPGLSLMGEPAERGWQRLSLVGVAESNTKGEVWILHMSKPKTAGITNQQRDKKRNLLLRLGWRLPITVGLPCIFYSYTFCEWNDNFNTLIVISYKVRFVKIVNNVLCC